MKIKPDIYALFSGLQQGSIAHLSRSITLLESQRHQDRSEAKKLMELVYPKAGNSFRIGITGPPGVGKSTFIEAFGNYLADEAKKLAVLTIDPSSPLVGGSILGDKTRMEELGRREGVYIRPSPSGKSLGGIALATREAMYACEAAGFEWIIIESAGVGQTDYILSELVDVMVLLALPGAGDELQGIKRGIMEMADLIVITKADGENMDKAHKAQIEHQSALHLFPPRFGGWLVPVVLSSAYTKLGLLELYEKLLEFRDVSYKSGAWPKRRKQQYQSWLKNLAYDSMQLELKTFLDNTDLPSSDKLPPYSAADELLKSFISDKSK